MPRGKKAPTIEQAQQWASHDVTVWDPRDERFFREQDTYFLKDRQKKKPGEERVTPNDPAFLSEKAARALAKAKRRLHVIPRDPSNPERAQKCENLGRHLWELWRRRYTTGIKMPLDYEEAKFLVQRGWLCSRLLLNPDQDSDTPVLYTVHDPAQVYPHEVNGEIVRVTHRYKATVSDLMASDGLEDGEEALSQIETSHMVWVYSQYTKWKGTYYHYSWSTGTGKSDSFWLKKPVEIGYMPWDITIAIGTPFKATERDERDYIERIGQSFFTDMMDMYVQQKRSMSLLATAIATEANPPTTLWLEEGGRVEASDISLKPGSRMVRTGKGRMEMHRVGPALHELLAYNQLIQERQNKSSFSNVVFGDQTGVESGYMGDVLKAGNADVLDPYIQALVGHHQRVMDKAYMLIGKYWPANMQAFVAGGVNRPSGWSSITATDILEENPRVIVSYSVMSPVEKLQLANTVAMLTDKNLISLPEARDRDWLDLDDPYVTEMLVMADRVKLDPMFIKAWIPLALAFTGASTEQQLYGMLHGGEIMQMLMQGLAMQQGQGQQGMSPQPGMPGTPTTASPLQMSQGPIDNGLLQMIQSGGGALPTGLGQGGGGYGGMPPV